MKGLLIKDLQLTLKSKKMMAVFLMVAFILFVTQGVENAAFIVGYMTMIGGMLVLSTISSDEYDRSNAFLMTMPVNRKIYAMEKYIFSLSCSLTAWIISTALVSVLQMSRIMEVLFQSVVVFLVLTLFQFIMLPVQLKYGGDKGRMVLVGMIAVLMILAYALKKGAEIVFTDKEEAEKIFLKFLNWFDSLNEWAIGFLFLGIWVICFIISFTISKNIMEKKEF